MTSLLNKKASITERDAKVKILDLKVELKRPLVISATSMQKESSRSMSTSDILSAFSTGLELHINLELPYLFLLQGRQYQPRQDAEGYVGRYIASRLPPATGSFFFAFGA
ncbi:hypothetical protein CEXT_788791 [Caerostris extrusa]|uniref:Uncharacterized protein n=1 Tax=Caerostris extrusa TaxID=172846 RepID=A0AAV4QX70_CAEEX|nr:hypothetical protein CEXT_788791 [Caerostris extrusa]